MTHPATKPLRHVLLAGSACALAVALAACGDKPAEQKSAPAPSGAAPSAASMSKAAEAAAPAAGTQAQVPAAAPAGSDAQLAAEVTRALRAHPELGKLAIDARAANGVVTLFGNAASDGDRRMAEQFVARLPGVKSVENKIGLVRGSSAAAPPPPERTAEEGRPQRTS